MTREETLAQLYSLVARPAAEPDTLQREVAQLTAPLVRAGGDTSTADPASASRTETTSRVGDQLALITQQLDLLRAVQQAQVEATTANTTASLASRVASAATSTLADTVTGGGNGGGFLSALGLSPLVSGLIRLFGGGDEGAATPAALVRYQAPEALRIDAGLAGGQLTEVSRGAGDRVRTLSPTVTVNVNAMDTQSFLDRSDDIARAVRQAMLEAHPINDVVADL